MTDRGREEAEMATYTDEEMLFRGLMALNLVVDGSIVNELTRLARSALSRARAAAIEEAAKKVESYSHSYFDSAANKLVVIDLKPIADFIRTLSQQEDGK